MLEGSDRIEKAGVFVGDSDDKGNEVEKGVVVVAENSKKSSVFLKSGLSLVILVFFKGLGRVNVKGMKEEVLVVDSIDLLLLTNRGPARTGRETSSSTAKFWRLIFSRDSRPFKRVFKWLTAIL